MGGQQTLMPVRHALLAVVVAATWGLNFVIIDVGLEEVPPLLLCAARFALVAFPLVFFVRRPPIPWRLLAGIGVALGVVKFGLLFTSMDVGMPAGLASVVLQAQAPFTLLLAAELIRERPSGRQLAGLGGALAGIALIAADNGGGVTAAGLALCIAAAAVGGALAGLDLRSIGAIVYIAACSTLGGFAAWSWLLRTYPAGQVASFALLVPPFGLGFGALLLHEHVGPAQMLAAALVVAGVALSTRTHPHPGRRGTTEPVHDRV